MCASCPVTWCIIVIILSQLIDENELQKVVSVIHKLPTELTPQDVGGVKVSQSGLETL